VFGVATAKGRSAAPRLLSGAGDYVCLYSDEFTPGPGASDADTTVVLDTDCDNSN
jgi:hypothetical protein